MIVDHKAFHELLIYDSCYKTKESDITHHTKITDSMIARAKQIQAALEKELKV